MFYQPELMVYMWMLPVVILIVIPSLWPVLRGLYRVVERSSLSDVRGFVEVSSELFDKEAKTERRREPRVRIEGPKAVVARQVYCCHSHVGNISGKGISFVNLPQRMFQEANDRIRVIFRSREREYSMLVQPRWKRKGDSGYELGAKILSIPSGWEKFVNGFCQPLGDKAA